MAEKYESPFTYFGNKKNVASIVWARLGKVKAYYEPFFGTGSMYFSCPFLNDLQRAVLNDLDGMVANFWRSVKYSVHETACHCDMGQHEIELHSRLLAIWRETPTLTQKLVEDATWHDPKLAGYWASVMSADLTPLCGTRGGPWQLDEKGRLTKCTDSSGVAFSKPNTTRKNCVRWSIEGRLERSLLILHDALMHAYVLCGGWERCFIDYQMQDSPIGVFFDPPYDQEVNNMYSVYKESAGVTSSVKQWCANSGKNRNLRIAVCGYEGEYASLVSDHGWTEFRWEGTGGYGRSAKKAESNGVTNRLKERIWFSPHCLDGATEACLFKG
jgi:site-specific DNA-adenine methylase